MAQNPLPFRGNDIHPLAWKLDEWQAWCASQEAASYRAEQIFRWLHQRGELNAERMTNLDKVTLGALTRLAESGGALSWPLEVEQVNRSKDGTRKLLLRLPDGKLVECVLIPMTNTDEGDEAAVDGDEEDQPTPGKQRVTLCISTQVGCAMGCVFCASGQAGLKRGLVAAEIVAQVLIARRYLDADEVLRNLVFMGMGEPLHHYNETQRSIELLTCPVGLGMSPRRITVSTVGLVPGIRKLGRDFGGKIGLAVSLHAPDDATRDTIMPVNQRFPVAELIQALREYPLPKRRRLTIEYTLIGDVNDSLDHAARLAQLLRGLRVKVNLIPMNPIEQSELREPVAAQVEAFREALAERRISCSIRKRRGDDVDAACGQLALKHVERTGAPSLKLYPVES